MCAWDLEGLVEEETERALGSRAARSHARVDEVPRDGRVRCEMKMDIAHQRTPDEIALCTLSAATSIDPVGPRHRVGDRVQRGIVELVATGDGASATDRRISSEHHVGVVQPEPARPHVYGGR